METLQLLLDNWELITGGVSTIMVGVVSIFTAINKIAPNVVKNTFIGRLIKKTNVVSLGTKKIEVE